MTTANVLHEAHYDGLCFTLHGDGKGYVRLRREEDAEPEYLFGPLTKVDGDERTALTMSHKLFNRMCKQAIREGDCDHLLARKAAEDAWRNAKKRHVEALYAIAQRVADEHVDEDAPCHAGLCPAERCSRCGPILEARRVLAEIRATYDNPRRHRT